MYCRPLLRWNERNVKIVSADFVGSCVDHSQYPKTTLPEVAFVGRSNVGKSSIINCLVNRKQLAKVSTTPGKTRTLNFFRIVLDDPVLKQLYFVDLPGYGYAKAARSLREQWGPMIEQYLRQSRGLVTVVQLVDMRGVEERDLTTHHWLTHAGLDPMIVGTKSDKLSRNDRNKAKTRMVEAFSCVPDDLVCSSAKTHEGRLEIWRTIRERYDRKINHGVTI